MVMPSHGAATDLAVKIHADKEFRAIHLTKLPAFPYTRLMPPGECLQLH